MEEYDTPRQQSNIPVCPLCQNQEFRKEEGRMDSRWGFTTHRLTLLVCTRCQFIMQFYEGNSIWDFD